MLVKLIAMKGAAQGRGFLLGEDGVLAFGRGGRNQVALPDPHLSRRHFEVTLHGGAAILRDLDSSNGTFVNGRRVTETPLEDGDTIAAGEHVFAVTFLLEEDDEETATLPRCGRCGRTVGAWELQHEGAVRDGEKVYCAGCAPASTVVLPRRRLGRFRVESVLGKGGMGTVYRAVDTREETTVALKVLQAHRAEDPEAVSRFLREARLGMRLEHDHIVRVYDVGDVRGIYYLSMEFVDGRSVAEVLEDSGALPHARAAAIVRQMAEALCHAAERGFVHRDIKPDNILLAKDGTAKLTDLGLAKSLEDSGLGRKTQGRVGLGTPHYMPPEQVIDAREADIRSDLYALGATWHHMLTGRPPFEGEKLHELIDAIRNRAAPTVAERGGSAPAWVDGLIGRLMEKRRADRFQTPQALLAALDGRMAGRGPEETAEHTVLDLHHPDAPPPPGAHPDKDTP